MLITKRTYNIGNVVKVDGEKNSLSTNFRILICYTYSIGKKLTLPSPTMSKIRTPRLWSLTKTETPASFESWCGTIVYNITLDSNFLQFLDRVWLKKLRTHIEDL